MTEEIIPDDQQETIDDVEEEGRWFHGATLWSTDWTTETILSQLRRGNINLNPRYQRRSSWRDDRKSRFIESLILGLPIPQIILAEEKTRRGSFIVIDGKQRLLSLRQFTADANDDFVPLELEALDERQDLNGLTFAALRERADLQEDVVAFENQTIRTVVIRNWRNEQYLYSVFLRINTGSLPLSPQELRQALHPGSFLDFVDQFSMDSDELRRSLSLRQPDFRMRDAELVLRYFAYKNFISQYSGGFKQFLDLTTNSLNDTWVAREAELRDQAHQLEEALIATRQIFSERGALRKWNGNEYERRVNRAVFDIMTFYLSVPAIRQAALQHAIELEEEFRSLCDDEFEFRDALERTTKSMDANFARFRYWGEALSRICNVSVPLPEFHGDPVRIRFV